MSRQIGHHRAFTEEQKEKIRKLYSEEKLTATQIAERFGRTASAIYTLLLQLGLRGKKK
jgi:transposase-like protein